MTSVPSNVVYEIEAKDCIQHWAMDDEYDEDQECIDTDGFMRVGEVRFKLNAELAIGLLCR